MRAPASPRAGGLQGPLRSEADPVPCITACSQCVQAGWLPSRYSCRVYQERLQAHEPPGCSAKRPCAEPALRRTAPRSSTRHERRRAHVEGLENPVGQGAGLRVDQHRADLPLERVQRVHAHVQEDGALAHVAQRLRRAHLPRRGAPGSGARASGSARRPILVLELTCALLLPRHRMPGPGNPSGPTPTARKQADRGHHSFARAGAEHGRGTRARAAAPGPHKRDARGRGDVVQRVVADGDRAAEQRDDAAQPGQLARQVAQVAQHADQRHLLRGPHPDPSRDFVTCAWRRAAVMPISAAA